MPNTGRPSNGQERNTGNNGKNEKPVQDMTTRELGEHLEGLRTISTIASKLFTLLGEQITSVSHTIPIQRGHEIVKNLRDDVKAQKEGIKIAFSPLRDHISQVKAGFWNKHGAALEAAAQKYIAHRVRERVLVEVNKQLSRYVEYLETNEAKTEELKEAVDVSDARFQNSLIRTQHPDEQITWIGNPPAPAITFDDLISADKPSALILAKSLGLSPALEDDRIDILNSIMRALGIVYKALPSWREMLLVPTRGNL